MSFDGVDDFIDLTPIDLSNSNTMTLMCWVYADDLQSEEWNTIVNQNWGEPNWMLQFYNYGNKMNFNVEDINGINYNLDINVNPSLFENSWHHITATYNGTSQKIYIDGVLLDSNIVNGDKIAYGGNNQSITNVLGSYSPSNNSESFDGNIENFSVWNKVLTSQEINQYLLCSPNGSESGLIGYWSFEEGSGNIVLDQTSNGNNGTINGATYNTNVPSQSCQLTNANGCDSTAVLNLTINNSDTSYTSVTACDSYTWNDSTYTQNGTYYSNTGSATNITGFTYIGSLNGSFYYYSQATNLWGKADSICKSHGGYLVTISDTTENNFINNFSNGMGIWLGLTDENNEGFFRMV